MLIITFLQSLEYVSEKLRVLLSLTIGGQQLLQTLALIVGIILVVHGIWPAFFVELDMKVRRTDFRANVAGRKVRLGQPIFLKAKFNGALRDGYFTAQITNMKGEILPTTKLTYEWLPYNDTYDINTKRGLLRGSGPFKCDWSWRIPLNYMIGEYEVMIAVYDGDRRIRATKPIPFKVVRGSHD